MSSNRKKLIAVIGATGQQGGAVVRALQAQGQFKVRALTRHPGKHRGLADEVVEADLDRPGNPQGRICRSPWRFPGHQFLGTRVPTSSSRRQRRYARPRKPASNTLSGRRCPTSEAISGGKLHVPHFTGKAKVDRIVKEAGFAHHTFVIAPFFYQNLVGLMAPQKQEDGTLGWALPIDPTVRGIHMGDITRNRQHRCRRIRTPGSGRQWRIFAPGR